MRDPLREAIRELREAEDGDWAERTPVVNVYNSVPDARRELPTKPDSDPPATSGAIVVTKSGVKVGKLPPVAVVAIVLGLAAIGGTVYVLIH